MATKLQDQKVAHERYPIQPGELWADQLGNRITVADLTSEYALSFARGQKPVRAAFIDIPYNQAMITNYRNRVNAEYMDFSTFLDGLLKILLDVDAPVIYVETGVATVDQVCMALDPLRIFKVWDITYYRKNPAKLVRLGRDRACGIDFTGVDDMDAPALMIHQETCKGDRVVDFCMGKGLTARSAQEQGRRFSGIELNPERAAVTIASLAETGSKWEVLGGAD